jgi:glutaredoxin 2
LESKDFIKSDVNEFVSAANSYRFKLSEMQIDFRKNFILGQKIIIRVKDDRKELAHFIDQLRESTFIMI